MKELEEWADEWLSEVWDLEDQLAFLLEQGDQMDKEIKNVEGQLIQKKREIHVLF